MGRVLHESGMDLNFFWVILNLCSSNLGNIAETR